MDMRDDLRRLLRHPVLPHVIGNLVAALDNRAQRLRVQFADPPRREDRRLDAVRIEQIDEPPDADPSAEFALCELHWRLIKQPAQQHRVEIAGEVDRNADTFGPCEVRDELVAGGVSGRRALQFRELLFQVCRRHCARSDVAEGSVSLARGYPLRGCIRNSARNMPMTRPGFTGTLVTMAQAIGM